MIDPTIGYRFVRSIADRDWAALAECFANEAEFHALIGHARPFREKRAFLRPGPDGIAACDLLCSGFLPIEPPRGTGSRSGGDEG